MLNNQPRKALECSQKGCPAASNIEYGEVKRSRQHLADLYRMVEGSRDTSLRITPAMDILPTWTRSAVPRTDGSRALLVQDVWMAKICFIKSISQGDGILQPNWRVTRKFMEQGHHIFVASCVTIRLNSLLPDTFDTRTSMRFPSPLHEVPGNLGLRSYGSEVDSRKVQFEYCGRACEIEQGSTILRSSLFLQKQLSVNTMSVRL